MKSLTFKDGIIRIDGVELRGILDGLRVACAVRFNGQKVATPAAKRKPRRAERLRTSAFSLSRPRMTPAPVMTSSTF